VIRPADHKLTKMMKPSEKPFHTPALAVAPQRAPFLSGGTTLFSVRAIISIIYETGFRNWKLN
jgi:hypothetical protein